MLEFVRHAGRCRSGRESVAFLRTSTLTAAFGVRQIVETGSKTITGCMWTSYGPDPLRSSRLPVSEALH